MHSKDFGNIQNDGTLFKKRKLIYIMINPYHNKVYVGQTNDMVARFTQHMKMAWEHKHTGKTTDRFHSYLAHNNFSDWQMVPIFLPIDNDTETNKMERRMIKLFGNLTLNSQHVLIHKRFNIAPTVKNKCQSEAHVRYSRNRNNKARAYHYEHAPKSLSVQRYQLLQNEQHIGYFYDLQQLLNHESVKNFRTGYGNRKFTVNITGNKSMCNWTVLKLKYGQTKISVPGRQASVLSNHISEIKQGYITSFEIKHRIIEDDEATYKILKHLGTCTRRTAKRTCRRSSFDHLLNLRTKANSILHHRRLKDISIGHIDFWLRKKFGFSYSRSLIVRIPFSPTLSKRDIRLEAVKLIKNLKVPKRLEQHMIGKLRVVFTKQRSIESLLCNHRAFSKNSHFENSVTHDQVPTACTCSLFHNLRKQDGHVIFKATDCNENLVKDVLHCNAKNIVKPTGTHLHANVQNALESFASDACNCFNTSVSHDNDIHNATYIPNLVSTATTTVLQSCNHRCHEIPEQAHSLPSTKTVIRLRKKYKGLIISPLDKNSGCLCVC